MNIRPLKDRVVVKRLESETRSLGGIIIPDSAKEKPYEGIVIAVGAGKISDEGKVIAPDIKVGARVLFGKYAGNEIEVDGESHIIMKEDDILGILN